MKIKSDARQATSASRVRVASPKAPLPAGELRKIGLANVHDKSNVHVTVNMRKTMNTPGITGAALEKALAAKLRELLGGIAWLSGAQVEQVGTPDAGFDLLATLPLPGGGKAALCVECKREFRPSLFRTLTDKTFSPAGRPKVVVPVLALPTVSPRVAELCAEHGWSWFDLAGNHRLDIPGLLHLQHTGNEPVHRPQPAANLSTPEAARIIRVLIAPGNAGLRWTQREMQLHCQPNVSIGLVNKVVRHLREEAFIELGKDGGFRLRDPLGLLTAWRRAYRFDRHQRHGYFTLLQGRRLQEALARLGPLTGGHAVYAAFSAAEFQAPHVRQPKTWLFVGEEYEEKFCAVAEAKRVDSGENVVVLIPEDAGVFYEQVGGFMGEQRLACTNPVQTYADLCNAGSRGEEAAEALLEQALKPEWKRRRLL